jgi:hypothetical protein
MLRLSSQLHFYGFHAGAGIAKAEKFALSSVDDLANNVASTEGQETLTSLENRRSIATERR